MDAKMEESLDIKLKEYKRKGDVDGILELANSYINTAPELAFSCYLSGPELNSPYLTWLLADAYYYGEGTEKSIDKALQYYEQAATLGQAEAYTSLGIYYLEELSGEEYIEKAIYYYSKAAALNEPHALHNLGVMYSSGQGVEINKEKAYELFFKAAELGHDEAMFKVGWCLLHGEGTHIDKPQAVVWLKRASDEENMNAIELLKDLNT